MARRVKLNPGEVFFGQGEILIETLLGSCIAITLWHPTRQLGGMCHYMLPTRLRPQADDDDRLDARYGDEAFLILLHHIERYHSQLEEYQAQIFGGANTLSLPATPPRQVGDSNCEFGLSLLAEHGLTIVGQHLGGPGYRLLKFDLVTGKVWVRYRDPPPAAPLGIRKTREQK